MFLLWVLAMDGVRFFATEDIGPMLLSPVTLSENDVTVILEWDRNSMEAPHLGPDLDCEMQSSLFVHRLADEIRLEEENETCRQPLYTISFEAWNTAISALRKTIAEQGVTPNA